MGTDVSCCVACNGSVKSFRSVRFRLNISSSTRLHRMWKCVQRKRPFLGWLPFVFSWSCSSSGFPSPFTHSRALTCGTGASQTRVSIRGGSTGCMRHALARGHRIFMGWHVWSERLSPQRCTGITHVPGRPQSFTSTRAFGADDWIAPTLQN